MLFVDRERLRDLPGAGAVDFAHQLAAVPLRLPLDLGVVAEADDGRGAFLFDVYDDQVAVAGGNGAGDFAFLAGDDLTAFAFERLGLSVIVANVQSKNGPAKSC